MPQSSGPIAQGTASERQFTDILWRDRFGDEPGVLGDMDGSAYAISLPAGSDVVSIGSTTQASLATVAGFSHRIPQSSPETITVPAAVGSARTDLIVLRYDPTYTGLPGPVRLFRIEGTSASVPSYDSSPPGVEDLPLWSITRQPGQGLNQATATRLFSRIAPSLEIPSASALPTSSPLGTVARDGTTTWKREIVGSSPAWRQIGGPPQLLASTSTMTGAGTVQAGIGPVGTRHLIIPSIPRPGVLHIVGEAVWTSDINAAGTFRLHYASAPSAALSTVIAGSEARSRNFGFVNTAPGVSLAGYTGVVPASASATYVTVSIDVEPGGGPMLHVDGNLRAWLL